jgi:site-specific DNA-adenine methylase
MGQSVHPLDIIAGSDDDQSMRYPGGKGKSFQHIINVLPPHETYIETHLGGGAVLRHKTPAITSYGVDVDPAVVRSWRSLFPSLATYIEADAVDFLASRRFRGDEVIYCDPPYLPSTRRRARVYVLVSLLDAFSQLLNDRGSNRSGDFSVVNCLDNDRLADLVDPNFE